MHIFIRTMKNLPILLTILFVSCCPPTGLVEPEQLCRNVIVTDARTDTLVYENISFGSLDDPLGEDEWGLQIVDNPVRVTSCVFYLDGGHGIGVWGVNIDVDYCLITDNVFVVMDSINTYVIRVGHDSSDPIRRVKYPVITGNVLNCVEADTYKHNLFIGGCDSAYVAHNEVHGGGYGIGVKNCDSALVEFNEVFNTSRQAIVEKGGLDCRFGYNFASVYTGTCFRITDDIENRQSFGSQWYSNTGVSYGVWQQIFSMSSPYNPAEQGFVAYDNEYYSDPEWSHSVLGTFYHLGDFQSEYGQETGSTMNSLPTSVPEEPEDY